MSLSSPYSQYQQNSVETASQTRLIIMLYDGAIRFLNQSLPAMQTKNYELQSHFLNKAQAIIAHLQGTLDIEAGGDIAKTLESFYATAFNALTDANIHDKPEKIHQVLHGLRELREAWVEVDRQCQASKSPSLSEITLSAGATLRQQSELAAA